MSNPNLVVAARFFSAIERGDIEAVRACYAPGARIWHNTDGVDFPGQTVAENLRILAWLPQALDNLRYDVTLREATATGFVQQHVLRATIRKTGAAYTMPACIVCAVEDGRIVRLDEYFDSAVTAELIKAAS